MSDERLDYENDFSDRNSDDHTDGSRAPEQYDYTYDSTENSGIDDHAGADADYSSSPAGSFSESSDRTYAGNSYDSSYSNGNSYGSSYSNSSSYGSSGSNSSSYGSNGSGTNSYSTGGTTNGSGTDSSGNRRYYSYDHTEDSSSNVTSPRRNTYRKNAKNKKKRGRLAVVLAVILVFVLGAGAGSMISSRSSSASLSDSSSSAKSRVESSVKEDEQEAAAETGSGTGGTTISRVEDKMADSDLSDTTVADVAEKVMPAIVSVYNKYTEESQFFGRTYTQEGESAGSGIIIEETDSELLIVTNNHVVEGADSLSVQFINEENAEAALKGTDASSDLAVISVSLDALSAETREQIAIAELGDSDSLRIGEHAIAIGNALGYGQSLTVGYISALNREITSEDGITGTFIQTDAAINPGNSGGALLNSRGQVIGINSNKLGGDVIEGMGFAIPISKAIPIIDGLKTQESKTKVAEEEQGVLGIYGISVTSDVASAYGLPVGAYVEEIIEDTGAAQSDLQEGDIITAINGQTVSGMEDLQNQLAYYSAGEEITLTIQHSLEGNDYEEREIKVTLSKRSEVSTPSGNSENPQGQQGQQWPSQQENDSDIFSFPFGF